MSLSASFADFIQDTRNRNVSNPNSILNDAQKYVKYMSRELIAGREKEMFQSGKEIEGYIQLDTGQATQNYRPEQTFTYGGADVTTRIEVPWRFAFSHYTWTDQELLLSGQDPAIRMVNLKKIKEQAAITSQWDFFEGGLWALPDTAEMEADTGKKPYSFLSFITHDGGAPTTANDAAVTSNWTTVEGVNPTSKPYWKNQVTTYDGTSATTIRDTILGAMDEMFLSLDFESPDGAEEYFKNASMRRKKIVASKKGVAYLLGLMRASNDRLTPINDLGYSAGKVTFAGIPIKHCSALDTVDATADTAGKPKFRWLDLNHFKMIFHSERYMNMLKVTDDPQRPLTHVALFDSYYQLFCESRRRQGLVRST